MTPNSETLDKLKAQLAQIDALIAEGVLTGDAAKTARSALEARVLAWVLNPGGTPGPAAGATAPAAAAALAASASASASASTPTPAPAAVRAPRPLVAGVAAFVLAFAVGGYAWLGNRVGWSVGPGEPGPQQAAHATESAQVETMIERLAERLKSKPDDAEGWSMLGRTYNSLGRATEALAAYKRAYELRPQDAQVLADYADGLAVVNNRTLDGEPERLIMQAVKLDPANVKALALAGTVAFNHNDFKAAVDYWERAIQASEPGGDFAKQLQGALAEARQRGGMPPVAAAPGAPGADLFAPAPAEPAAAVNAANANAPAATAGAEAITGRLTLKAELKGQVGPDDTVFIFARAPTGSKMPLAILRKKVSDLPLDFKLDDSLAMSPAARLSSASQVVVGARISKTGNAMPSPGDLQVLSAPMALGARDVRIEIAEAVR